MDHRHTEPMKDRLPPLDLPDQTGRTWLVTGATNGVGHAQEPDHPEQREVGEHPHPAPPPRAAQGHGAAKEIEAG